MVAIQAIYNDAVFLRRGIHPCCAVTVYAFCSQDIYAPFWTWCPLYGWHVGKVFFSKQKAERSVYGYSEIFRIFVRMGIFLAWVLGSTFPIFIWLSLLRVRKLFPPLIFHLCMVVYHLFMSRQGGLFLVSFMYNTVLLQYFCSYFWIRLEI